MRGAAGFAKGFLTGTLVGGAICMMVEPPSATKMKKAYRKTNHALKTMGCAIEDLVVRR